MSNHNNERNVVVTIPYLRRQLNAVAAILMVAGLSLSPGAAYAIDECAPTPGSGTQGDGVGGASDPSLNGAAADSFDCALSPIANGVTYSSDGDLTVTKTNSGNTSITANGVNLTGNGGDNVTWNSSAGGLIIGTGGTTGGIVDVTTASGDISITTANVIGQAARAAYAIRANSAGGGDISIERNGSTATAGLGTGGLAAIEAITAGGDISILGSGAIIGRERAILAQTSGTGLISIFAGSNVSAHAAEGIVGIDTVAGLGDTVVDMGGGTVTGGPGLAIRAVSSGGRFIFRNGRVNGRVDLSGIVGGSDFSGGLDAGASSLIFTGADDIVSLNGSLIADGEIQLGVGDDELSFSVFNARIGSQIELGEGADTVRVTALSDFDGGGGYTDTGALLDFGAGADALIAPGAFWLNGGRLHFGEGDDTATFSGVLRLENATIDFGADNDAMTVDGALFSHGISTIQGLESFDNTGIIYMGGKQSQPGGRVERATDNKEDDALFISSGIFTGSQGSRIVLDANLGGGISQPDCTTPVASDCVNFTGATTAGSTAVTVQDISFARNGGSFGSVVTLIEGATAAEHFTLDPASTYFEPTPQGDAIRKTLVAYTFLYDPDTQRHVLVGSPTDEVYQMGTLAATAQETWRMSTGSWLSRQADMRAVPGGLQGSNGVWAKVTTTESERDEAAAYNVGSINLGYDLTHQQRSSQLLFGADMLGGETATGAWVAGAMLGFVRSDFDFDATPTDSVSTGTTGGVYASYVDGPLFIDTALNINQVHYTVSAPQMGLGDDVNMLFDSRSIGGQVEAGWRIAVTGFFVEPLVGVSYVSTKFDNVDVPAGGGGFDFGDKFSSLRFGGGARLGMKAELLGLVADYSLLARYWNESEARNQTTVLAAGGSSIQVTDAFDGQFTEITAGINLFSSDGGITGFFNIGGEFGDNYQSMEGSVGVRVRW